MMTARIFFTPALFGGVTVLDLTDLDVVMFPTHTHKTHKYYTRYKNSVVETFVEKCVSIDLEVKKP